MCFVLLFKLFLPLWIFTSLNPSLNFQFFQNHLSFFHFLSSIRSLSFFISFLVFKYQSYSTLLSRQDVSQSWPRKEQGESPLCYLPPSLTEIPLSVGRLSENIQWALPLLILQKIQVDGLEHLWLSGLFALGPKFQSLQTKNRKERKFYISK